MRKHLWLAALAAILALGLIAAGCGGGDDTSTSTVTVGGDTSTSTEATTTDESTSTSEDSGTSGSTPDDVYNACIDVIEGTPAEDATKPACEQARDAFQQCIDQANAAGGSAGDTAAQLCQDAADQTIAGLKAAG